MKRQRAKNVSETIEVSMKSGGLHAYPNTTSTQTAKHDANYTWTSLQLDVPINSGSGNTITLAQDASSSGADGGWRLYGSYVFFYDSSKQLVSYFFC